MTIGIWIAFVAVWVAFVAFPGPNAAYAMVVGSRDGDAPAVAAAGGFAFAVAVYVTGVAFGLLAFITASAELFEALRWVGVGYLFYLAVQSWRAPASIKNKAPEPKLQRYGSTFMRAALISLTNPKSALAYVVVYPPFMSTAGDAVDQLIILGVSSVILSFVIYSLYGLAAGRLKNFVRTPRQAKMRNRAFGVVFAGAGLALAATERR